MSDVSYLIFDVEAIADGELISRIRYPNESLSADDAVAKYREELSASRSDGKDFIPYTFMLPISVAVAKVSADFRLIDASLLDEPDYRPHVITQHFWQGWRHYQRPTLVTFNGRGYDLPVMELAGYRYGLNLGDWFNVNAKTYEQFRNRYNIDMHIDLMDLFSNFGATRMVGGLNLLANLVGKPGKMGVDGSQVQDMHNAGRTQEVNDYCLCDVLDTYFVFLRSRVMLGRLSLEDEHARVAEAKQFLTDRKNDVTAFGHYLDHWGDWQPPE